MNSATYYFNSIKEFYDYYTDPDEEKHIIGLFGNKVVDYINIFIRILIFISIIFLILKNLYTRRLIFRQLPLVNG